MARVPKAAVAKKGTKRLNIGRTLWRCIIYWYKHKFLTGMDYVGQSYDEINRKKNHKRGKVPGFDQFYKDHHEDYDYIVLLTAEFNNKAEARQWLDTHEIAMIAEKNTFFNGQNRNRGGTLLKKEQNKQGKERKHFRRQRDVWMPAAEQWVLEHPGHPISEVQAREYQLVGIAENTDLGDVYTARQEKTDDSDGTTLLNVKLGIWLNNLKHDKLIHPDFEARLLELGFSFEKKHGGGCPKTAVRVYVAGAPPVQNPNFASICAAAAAIGCNHQSIFQARRRAINSPEQRTTYLNRKTGVEWTVEPIDEA